MGSYDHPSRAALCGAKGACRETMDHDFRTIVYDGWCADCVRIAAEREGKCE